MRHLSIAIVQCQQNDNLILFLLSLCSDFYACCLFGQLNSLIENLPVDYPSKFECLPCSSEVKQNVSNKTSYFRVDRFSYVKNSFRNEEKDILLNVTISFSQLIHFYHGLFTISFTNIITLLVGIYHRFNFSNDFLPIRFVLRIEF